ncbi:unnamed protein product [Urochloa decumbens]|uniref:Cathepsin propeptide inhibitor domain-containing protein n=1 Tax=Urochloa decumbens TaxID=240449 RepID=A0ABC8XPK7_9POAL
MSLRSLGYLLTRRFYPRKICSQQAEFLPGIVSQAASVPAAGGPGRSLHSLRDLGYGENAYGPLVATALVGGLGILIFKKHPDGADNNVTDKDTKEVRNKKPEVTDNKPMQVQVTNIEKRDVDMEARFHEWMKRVGRAYPNCDEEARRFELFKERVKLVESLHKSSFPYLPNKFADRTDKEIMVMTARSRRVPFTLESQRYEDEALSRMVEMWFLFMKTEAYDQGQRRNVHSSKEVMQLATDP